MLDYQLWLTFGVFITTVIFLMWRPRGINESIPTSLCALLLIITRLSSYTNIIEIFGIVSGAAVTILSTIVMSIILDSIGFFRWIAINMIDKAKGSGIKLFCSMLRLKMQQQLPYLLSGALIATASSAPIGLSNLANLIALQMVGLDLNQYTLMMFDLL